MSIDLDKGGACRECSVRRLSDQWTRPADFPAINPSFANRRNRFVYAGAASGSRRFLPFFPFDSVVKVDVKDEIVKAKVQGVCRCHLQGRRP